MVLMGGKNQEGQQISSGRTTNGRAWSSICPYIMNRDLIPINKMCNTEQHLLLDLALNFGLTQTF